MIPTTRQWTITAKYGLDGLKLERDVQLPALGQNECLVKIAAVSLNYRDVAIPAGKYPGFYKDKLVPCSDGAGTIVAIGEDVTLHKSGDRVCTLFNQAHQQGVFTKAMGRSMLGNEVIRYEEDRPDPQYAAERQRSSRGSPTKQTEHQGQIRRETFFGKLKNKWNSPGRGDGA